MEMEDGDIHLHIRNEYFSDNQFRPFKAPMFRTFGFHQYRVYKPLKLRKP